MRPGRPVPATPPRLVGRAGRPGPGAGHRPVVRRRAERAGRLPGQYGPLFPRARRPALGVPVPVSDGTGPGGGRGGAGRRSRHRPVGGRGRGLDGRHAGPGVGGEQAGAYGFAAGARRPGRRLRRADRLGLGADRRDPLGPGVAGWRLPRRSLRRRSAPGPRPGAPHRPHHVPQRARTRLPVRRRAAAGRGAGARRALPGGVLSRPPRGQVGAPLRRGQLCGAHRGDERARHRQGPGRHRPGAAPGGDARAGRGRRLGPALSALPAGGVGGAAAGVRRPPARQLTVRP